MQTGKRILPVILFLMCFLNIHARALEEPKCKVVKELIALKSSERPGFIIVVGNPGAVNSTSAVTTYIENLGTHALTRFNVTDNFGFEAAVQAAAGDQVRVYARNQEGKRSYGTFKVPQFQTAAPPETAEVKPAPSLKPKEPLKPKVPLKQLEPLKVKELKGYQPPNGTRLAVIVTVVNIDDGEIVAAQRLAGPTRIKPGDNARLKTIINKIIERCMNIAKSEINRLPTPMRNIPPVNQPSPTTPADDETKSQTENMTSD